MVLQSSYAQRYYGQHDADYLDTCQRHFDPAPMLLGVIICSRDRLLESMRLFRRGNTEVDGEADVHLAYTVDHRSGA